MKRRGYSLANTFNQLIIRHAINQQNVDFFFNILNNENTVKFLAENTFYTFELIKNNILQEQLSQHVLPQVYLNLYESSFKLILLLLVT